MSAASAVSILSVGSAGPAVSYEQEEIARFLRIDPDAPDYRFFLAEHVRRRRLAVDSPPSLADETSGALYVRHREASLSLSAIAARKCLESASVGPADISHICCVTSTGLLLPSLSARLTAELGLSNHIRRADLVGMGCSAAINGLGVAADWVRASHDAVCLLVCCEVNSALYVTDKTSENAVVNSLFGDGAGAVLVGSSTHKASKALILGIESQLEPAHASMLRYEWSEASGRLRFRLDPQVPRVLGQAIRAPVSRLLAKLEIEKSEVAHWIVHGGGRAILAQVAISLNLPAEAVGSAISVLRENGNLGSASVLVCMDSVINDEKFPGEGFGVLIAMGPGLSVECAALRFVQTSRSRAERGSLEGVASGAR